MRVLIVTGIFPPDIGGPATYVPRIADALRGDGHCVEIVTLAEAPDDGPNDGEVKRIRRGRWRPLRVVTTVAAVLARAREADVVFVNGLALEATLANVVARKPLVMKVVGDLAWERAINHGWTDVSFGAFQTAGLDRRVERLKRLRSWWTRRADAVIVPSRFLAETVGSWGVERERVAVIANAPMKGSCEGTTPRPAVDARVVAVSVGRLVKWKRVSAVLDAMAPVPDLGLVVVGDGGERRALEEHARRLGLGSRVLFAGERSQAETLGMMAACDLLVLASSYEGLPHVVLEAAALGVPAVATAAGGTPEAVDDGETGVLVQVGDGGALTVALRRMTEDTEWRMALGRAARERAAGHTWALTAEETLGVLGRVAGGRRRD